MMRSRSAFAFCETVSRRQKLESPIGRQESSANLEHPLDSATVSQKDLEIDRRDSCDFAALTILLGIKGFTGRHDGSRFD